MSGPKTIYVPLSPRRLFERHLSPLLRGIEQAASEASAAEGSTTQADLAVALERLRADLRTFRVQGAERAAMLVAARQAEAALTRVRDGLAAASSGSSLRALMARMLAAPNGGSESSILALRNEAELALGASEAARGARREAAQLLRIIQGFAGGNGNASSDVRKLDEGLLLAARAEYDAEAAAVGAIDASDLALGGIAHGVLDSGLRQVDQSLTSGRLEDAARHLTEVRRLRIAAMHQATHIRSLVETRDILAGGLADALSKRSYDEPHCHLADGPGGEDRPLVLYAHNPAGTAHVRITMTVDGAMTVEVEGVAEGEEEVCVDVLHTLAQQVANNGDRLEILDAGRAKHALERARQRHVQAERQSEQRREREGR